MSFDRHFDERFNNIDVDKMAIFDGEGTRLKRYSSTTAVAVLPSTIELPEYFTTVLVTFPYRTGQDVTVLMVVDQMNCVGTVYRYYDTPHSVYLDYYQYSLENQGRFSEQRMYTELFVEDWWEETMDDEYADQVVHATLPRG